MSRSRRPRSPPGEGDVRGRAEELARRVLDDRVDAAVGIDPKDRVEGARARAWDARATVRRRLHSPAEGAPIAANTKAHRRRWDGATDLGSPDPDASSLTSE